MQTMIAPIRVLLADDHPTLRAGVRAVLEAAGDLVVVGEVDHGDLIVPRCLETQADVLLLDIDMPGPGPLPIVAALHTACPALKVVVLSAHDEEVYVRSLLAAGVAGYVRKDEPAEAIVDAVHSAARGGTWLSRPIAERLGRATEGAPALALTERELAVLRLLVEGRSNREISQALGVSEQLIERRIHEIFVKLGVTSRVMAAVKAVREGLV
jgi:DNA-binding NarL/FixJ family response regulator